jgi:hypothetical protein
MREAFTEAKAYAPVDGKADAMTDTQDILSGLASMTPEQRSEIAARCAMLDGHEIQAAPKAEPLEGNARTVGVEYVRALKNVLFDVPPLAVFMSTGKLGPKLRRQCVRMTAYVERRFLAKRSASFLAVSRMLFRLMLDDLREKRIPIGPKTLVQQMERIEAVVETAFPGYADADALRAVIGVDGLRKMKAERN